MPLSEEHKKRRGRNYALAAVLIALIVLFFMITLAKMGT